MTGAVEHASDGCIDADVAARYLDGVLGALARSDVEQHIDRCVACRVYLSELARAVSIATAEGAAGRPFEALLPSGSSVGRYVVGDVVGVGGMGVVYAARDPQLARRVALKRIRGDSADPARHELLLREARAMARLSHPNVVAVHDVVLHGQQLYLAMELFEGVDLAEWLRGSRPSWSAITAAFRDAGRGLAAAHAAGLVHRDFKAANVLGGVDGRIAVTDFGLARPANVVGSDEAHPAPLHARDGGTSARSGIVAGTPRYMAPEQRRGEEPDARSDQYSFCVALYEALYGEHPVGDVGDPLLQGSAGLGWSVDASCRRSQAKTNLPSSIRKVLARGLSFEPTQRYPSMNALLSALGAVLDPAAGFRWPRYVAILGAICALAALVVSTRRSAAAPGFVCSGAEQRLAGIWDSDRKRVISAAFDATRQPHAARTWQSVERVVDQHVRAWVAQHTDACEATHVRGEQSAELLDRRMTCLEERRKELVTLADVFAHADVNVVGKAVQAAESLTPSSVCDAATALARPAATSVPPEKRRRVEALRAELSQVRVLDAVGKSAEGVERSRVAVKEAEELADAQLQAEALLVLGKLQISRGDFDAAERTLRRSAALADAAADDHIRVQALSKLLWVVGYASANHDAVPSLRETAAAVLTRLHDSDEDAVIFYNSLSAALGAAGDGPGATAADDQVLALLEKLGRQNTRSFALALNNAASNHLLEGEARYVDVLAAAQRALALLEQTGGVDDPAVASIHATIGFVLTADLRFAEAERSFRRAAEVTEGARGGLPVAPYLDYLGFVRGEQGDFEGALQNYRRALALREKALRADHPDLIVSLAGIGQCYVALNRPREAVPFLERALRIPAPADLELAPADAQFELARALDRTPREQRRARGLAEKALAAYEAHAKNALDRRRRDEIRAWLVQRGRG